VSNLSEIETMLRGPGDLRQRIVRDLGGSTVALFGVVDSNGGDLLKLAGTGSLVVVSDSHGILTAAHVWDDALKSAAKVGITLTDNINHKCLIDVQAIVPTIIRPGSSGWNEWGPDMAFLRIPSEFVGGIKAFQVFENLAKPPKTLNVESLERWVAMGTPKELGTFTKTHAEVQISGDFVDPRFHFRGEHDYYDFQVDTTRAGMPKSFGGFSGGGLWRVLVHRSPVTGKLDWAQRLKGVMFWQSPVVKGKRLVRCHGPRSLLALVEKAVCSA
jgi:Trypsin